MLKNKGGDNLRGHYAAEYHLCFHFIDLLSKSEISSHLPSVAVQPGLCRTWTKTPKTGFVRHSYKSYKGADQIAMSNQPFCHLLRSITFTIGVSLL